MSRSVPWRNKPTQLITQMIPVATEYKLYLIHETGPTSFVFKDDNDNKFKVSIGDKVTCSCGIVQNDHCIHTLYVLLKRFRVPPTNPIIWQASYLDSELQGFVQFKFEYKTKEERKKHRQFKKVTPLINEPVEECDDFPLLDEDWMCPICYEQSLECYSTCKGCKKSIHTKCLKIWSLSQTDINYVRCPLCRAKFQNPMLTIMKDFQKWELRYETHKGTICKGCGVKNIKGLIYKCLLCSGYDLCKLCFEGYQHPEHQKFILKHMINESWKWAPIRLKKTKKQVFQPLKELNIKELTNIEENQSILVDLFPTLKQYSASLQISEFGIIGNQVIPKQQCFKCKKSGNEMMKRLNCGHSVHQQCLKYMITNKEYLCEMDNQVYCPGYFEAMGIKVMKNKKKPVECAVTKNQEEINRINDNINRLEINGFVPMIKAPEKRNHSVGGAMNKSKDRNFRILKKTMERKSDDIPSFSSNNLGLIMITGLGQHSQNPVSQIRQPAMNHPPKMRSNNFR